MPVSAAGDRPFVPISPGVLTPPSDHAGPCQPDTLVRKPWRAGGREQEAEGPADRLLVLRGGVQESAKQVDLVPKGQGQTGGAVTEHGCDLD